MRGAPSKTNAWRHSQQAAHARLRRALLRVARRSSALSSPAPPVRNDHAVAHKLKLHPARAPRFTRNQAGVAAVQRGFVAGVGPPCVMMTISQFERSGRRCGGFVPFRPWLLRQRRP